VTIVEQARELRTGGQAVDIRGPALTVLEKMGLLEEVRAGATKRLLHIPMVSKLVARQSLAVARSFALPSY